MYCIIKKYASRRIDTPITIIGITGIKRSGKDTIGNYLTVNYGFVKLAFADVLKEACRIIFSFSDEQLYGNELKDAIDEYWRHSPREILQKVGTELFRDTLPMICQNIKNDIWVRAIEKKILKMKNDGIRKFVITDIRFPNEAEFVKIYDGIIWKVIRSNSIKDNNSTHISEVFIDALIADTEIYNDNDIKDLYRKIDNLIKKY